MSKQSELKFVVSLLDDKTPDVRDNVLATLKNYGPELELDIYELGIPIPEGCAEILAPIFKEYRKQYILARWETALSALNFSEKIENTLYLLECYHHGRLNCRNFFNLLDDLKTRFQRIYPDGDEIDLSNFLFKINGISGAKDDYYNPLNSSIIYAIQNNKGLPITLALIYILIGKRLGLNIEGVNFPGHFLARTYIKDEPVLIDGFNGGKILQKADIAQLADKATINSIFDIIDRITPAELIIRRILNNLINSANQRNDALSSEFFRQLLKFS